MTDTQETHYDANFAAFLEEVWGKGYLSPGGPEEVAKVLVGLDLTGQRVLDIGCGTGAISISLARDYGAERVIGIDVEGSVCACARENVVAEGLSGRVDILEVQPGPLPFEAATFDLVFSKDSIVHISNKEEMAANVFEVLRPGGIFAASDWLISHDGPPTPEMQRYIALEDIDLNPASPNRYVRALVDAGFEDVNAVNRNEWYYEEAKSELAMLTGPRRQELETRFGQDLVASNIEVWTAMVAVLATGEHCPHHLRGRKPRA